MRSCSRKLSSRISSLMPSRQIRFDIEERRERRKATKMTRVVMAQALNYCIVFWITWLPGTVNRILQEVGDSFFLVMLLHVIFTPLQGLLNFFVYINPRVKKWWAESKKARSRAKKIRKCKLQKKENDEVCVPEIKVSGNAISDDDDDDDDNHFDVDESIQFIHSSRDSKDMREAVILALGGVGDATSDDHDDVEESILFTQETDDVTIPASKAVGEAYSDDHGGNCDVNESLQIIHDSSNM